MSILDPLSAIVMNSSEAPFTLTVDDVPLRVVRFTGSEAISRPFEFRVEVATVDGEPDPEVMVGRFAHLSLQSVHAQRSVHGLIYGADYIGCTRDLQRYELTLGPWAHLLLHRANCRIFQGKTTEQIVGAVLTRAGLQQDWFRFALSGTYKPRDYCVQYRGHA